MSGAGWSRAVVDYIPGDAGFRGAAVLPLRSMRCRGRAPISIHRKVFNFVSESSTSRTLRPHLPIDVEGAVVRRPTRATVRPVITRAAGPMPMPSRATGGTRRPGRASDVAHAVVEELRETSELHLIPGEIIDLAPATARVERPRATARVERPIAATGVVAGSREERPSSR